MSNQKNISRYCESEGGEEKAREKRREEGKEEGRHRGGSLQDGAEEKKSLPRCRGDIAEWKKNFSEKRAGPILHWEFARGPKVRESGKNLWGGGRTVDRDDIAWTTWNYAEDETKKRKMWAGGNS